ncbi:hypothetical protein [Bradyrhizobium yuanmingense]|uniref:hypothetical protein n=1 Tax=Bradyrhizobium yuanmingense TaxID=108015 RepID=UPI0023B997DA|nr:hypothetical protein [Bradyrhizobium yuanmingense]MDF0498412.1 hypothetical protein [Bradyrhizobium yuanmingense]
MLAGIMGGLIISGKRVAPAIDGRMTALWRRAVTPTLRALKIARSSASTRGDLILMGLRSGGRHYISPALPVVAIAYLGTTVGNRLVFTVVDQAGLFCEPTKNLESIPDAGALVSFETSNICFATGYKVARLERYYVWTNPDPAALARQYEDYATRTAAKSPRRPRRRF